VLRGKHCERERDELVDPRAIWSTRCRELQLARGLASLRERERYKCEGPQSTGALALRQSQEPNTPRS
jgi:hypothetical protein